MAKNKHEFDGKYIVYVIIALIIAVPILVYVYLNFSYKMRVLETETQAKKDNEIKLANCKNEVHYNYLNWWNSNCKEFGINIKTDGCSLPTYIGDKIESKRISDLENCVKLYGN